MSALALGWREVRLCSDQLAMEPHREHVLACPFVIGSQLCVLEVRTVTA